MDDLAKLIATAGIVNESKYGYKFDQFKHPFKNDNKKILDSNNKFLCECSTGEMAKELAAILSDLHKMRELCDRMMSLGR